MLSEKYEIEFLGQQEAGHYLFAMVSMLTGYSMNELIERLPQRLHTGGWYGRDFREVFTLLGFDCTPKFKKFDPATPHPCLLRFRPTKRQIVLRKLAGYKRPDYWDVFVYYDGLVYSPEEECVYPLTLFSPAHKVTSMMQVWISDL